MNLQQLKKVREGLEDAMDTLIREIEHTAYHKCDLRDLLYKMEDELKQLNTTFKELENKICEK